jgi:hypothetical protein
MKTKNRILTALALALLTGYSIYSSVRILQAERRLEHLQREQRARPTLAQVDGVYSEAFLHYFGQKGVAEIERAREMLGDPMITRVAKAGGPFDVTPGFLEPDGASR